MAIWISRDDYGFGKDDYDMWTHKPMIEKPSTGARFYGDAFYELASVRKWCFERMTGIKRKLGECRRVKLIKVVLEPQK